MPEKPLDRGLRSCDVPVNGLDKLGFLPSPADSSIVLRDRFSPTSLSLLAILNLLK